MLNVLKYVDLDAGSVRNLLKYVELDAGSARNLLQIPLNHVWVQIFQN